MIRVFFGYGSDRSDCTHLLFNIVIVLETNGIKSTFQHKRKFYLWNKFKKRKCIKIKTSKALHEGKREEHMCSPEEQGKYNTAK